VATYESVIASGAPAPWSPRGCDPGGSLFLGANVNVSPIPGRRIQPRTRDMVFALVEVAAGRGEWEAISMWPNGELKWFEVARYGLL